MQTIEFGAFIEDANADRLSEAQRVARSLGVQISADGSTFAGSGSAGDPVKVTVTLPAGTSLTTAMVAQGRDALDNLLDEDERLTDYALVKQDGTLTGVVSLLTGEAKSVAQPAAAATQQAAPAAPAAPRRWSPFRRA